MTVSQKLMFLWHDMKPLIYLAAIVIVCGEILGRTEASFDLPMWWRLIYVPVSIMTTVYVGYRYRPRGENDVG